MWELDLSDAQNLDPPLSRQVQIEQHRLGKKVSGIPEPGSSIGGKQAFKASLATTIHKEGRELEIVL